MVFSARDGAVSMKSSTLFLIVLALTVNSGISRADPIANSKRTQASKGEIKTVVILGNSLVSHTPDLSIGWSGNWGMAASCADSDFVHRLTRDIHQVNRRVRVVSRNIYTFEIGYRSYNFSQLKAIKELTPGMIILAIGENVVDSTAVPDDFIEYYNRLLDYLGGKKCIEVIVDSFWKNRHVNSLIREYASRKHLPLVSITALSSDARNRAGRRFANAGVALHPSDKGMRLIADKIWKRIKTNF